MHQLPRPYVLLGALVSAAVLHGHAAAPAEAAGGPATQPIQTSAGTLSPAPSRAKRDRGRAFSDGCHLKKTRRTRSGPCVYGRRSSSTRVVNLGDSHALQYFPAMRALARQRGWRLVNLSRAGCTVADVSFRRACDAWRRHSLRRIGRMRPDLVVVHHATTYPYRVRSRGGRLSRGASRPRLQAGLARTLRRLRRTGARVVVVRDMPKARAGVVKCVARNREHLRRCASPPRRSARAAFDARAARRVKRVRLVDPKRALCTGGICPAVIGDVLVYRNPRHLTATYGRTLAGWLGERLPERFRR